MSLYGTKLQIGGVTCGIVMRGSGNGKYLAVFEREFASLEDIEAIAWDKPEIQGECILPEGYGFEVADIRYSAATRSYTVELQVAQQYLGDVAGYEAQVSELESAVAEKEAAISQQAILSIWKGKRKKLSDYYPEPAGDHPGAGGGRYCQAGGGETGGSV